MRGYADEDGSNEILQDLMRVCAGLEYVRSALLATVSLHPVFDDVTVPMTFTAAKELMCLCCPVTAE